MIVSSMFNSVINCYPKLYVEAAAALLPGLHSKDDCLLVSLLYNSDILNRFGMDVIKNECDLEWMDHTTTIRKYQTKKI